MLTSKTAASHSTYANILKSDFEQPVRDLPNKMTAWRRIGDQESSMERALKDYEKVSIKLDKASSKSKSSKAEQLQHELSQLTAQLNQLTPATYSTFQRLDEERLRALKEVIVRWATLRGDMATKSGERAESAVAAVLSWEPTDEVIAVGNRLSRAHNGSEIRASGGGAGGGNLSVESTRMSHPEVLCLLNQQTDEPLCSLRPVPTSVRAPAACLMALGRRRLLKVVSVVLSPCLHAKPPCAIGVVARPHLFTVAAAFSKANPHSPLWERTLFVHRRGSGPSESLPRRTRPASPSHRLLTQRASPLLLLTATAVLGTSLQRTLRPGRHRRTSTAVTPLPLPQERPWLVSPYPQPSSLRRGRNRRHLFNMIVPAQLTRSLVTRTITA